MIVLQIGLEGEKLNIFTEQGSHRFEWTKVNKGPALALTWYKVLLFLKTYLHNKMACGFERELICKRTKYPILSFCNIFSPMTD